MGARSSMPHAHDRPMPRAQDRPAARGAGFALEGWLATAMTCAPRPCQRKHARSVHPLLGVVVLASLGLGAYGVHRLEVGRALQRWTRLTAPVSTAPHAAPLAHHRVLPVR